MVVWVMTTWNLLYVQVTLHRDNLRINNQQDASVIQTLFCHETLHVSGNSCAHHQELSAVHVEIAMFLAGYVAAALESQVGTEFMFMFTEALLSIMM